MCALFTYYDIASDQFSHFTLYQSQKDTLYFQLKTDVRSVLDLALECATCCEQSNVSIAIMLPFWILLYTIRSQLNFVQKNRLYFGLAFAYWGKLLDLTGHYWAISHGSHDMDQTVPFSSAPVVITTGFLLFLPTIVILTVYISKLLTLPKGSTRRYCLCLTFCKC